jgi:hypothetical protein
VGGEWYSSPWYCRQYETLKRHSTSKRLHYEISQNAVIVILSAVRTWIVTTVMDIFTRCFLRDNETCRVTWMYPGPGSSVSVWLRTVQLRDRDSIPAGAKSFSSNVCVQTGSEAHPAFCPMCTGGPFPGAKHGRGVALTTHPHVVPRSRKSRSYTSSPLKRHYGV